MDKAYTATNAERDAEKAFTKYIEEQEQAYGTLVDRVNRLEQKHKVLTQLEIQAEEIRDGGNIIAYEKQATSQGPNTLSEEQMERLNDELENQKTVLNDTCRMTHYNVPRYQSTNTPMHQYIIMKNCV